MARSADTSPRADNGLSDDELIAAVAEELEFRRQIQAIGKTRKSRRQILKSRNVKLANFDKAIHYYEQDDPEAGADIAEMLKYLRILNVDVGGQLDLFKAGKRSAPEQTRAYRLGYAWRVQGKPATVPDHIAAEDVQDFLAGYHAADAKIGTGMTSLTANESDEDEDEDEDGEDGEEPEVGDEPRSH